MNPKCPTKIYVNKKCKNTYIAYTETINLPRAILLKCMDELEKDNSRRLKISQNSLWESQKCPWIWDTWSDFENDNYLYRRVKTLGHFDQWKIQTILKRVESIVLILEFQIFLNILRVKTLSSCLCIRGTETKKWCIAGNNQKLYGDLELA